MQMETIIFNVKRRGDYRSPLFVEKNVKRTSLEEWEISEHIKLWGRI